ncbi:adenylyltransferase/cytidyltransferase family protein [Anaerocolumna xylanovorans]|uniref:Glycerol-3-phosphate cytidylyltransferase n=1 Tax=Anaerocolumna xylanovorans DSM 12503 TaxID=1121345 RepID=A0A1M7Y832_9FIRM|nr:adenylyltransferase/cytidyltransferase family protein [Anaerocolumna xylanovorans]SHO48779.1 glycerol-3-phosphate cytidylyltransferase [Anaerocolumna xylanovorans DSM 12503]
MHKYKIGYTDGVYDMFHVGHLNMINQAREYCDYLIVGVHSDNVVKEYKHRQPLINEEDRCKIVEAIKGVDQAVITRFRDKVELWKLYQFDAVFIGDDWKGTERWNYFEKLLKPLGVDVIYIPYTKGISTSEIRKRIAEDEKSE